MYPTVCSPWLAIASDEEKKAENGLLWTEQMWV